MAFLKVVALVELLVAASVAVLLARRWLDQRSPATAAVLGVFALVAVVVASSLWQPADPTRGAGAVYTELVVLAILALPYLQVRFTWALGGVGDRVHRAAAGLYGVEAVVTVVLPPLPPEGAPRNTTVLTYTAFVLVAWVLQAAVAATGLWRAGRGAPAVVRNRMRALSLGAVVMALAIVLSGVSGGDGGDAVQVTLALVGLLSVLLFALAFLVPASLRQVWRQQDLTALAAAERGLMTATAREQVAATIVPALSSVLGAGGAALLELDGTPVLSEGLTEPPVATLGEHRGDGAVRQVLPGMLAAAVHDAWLVVQAGRLAPVFGDDEAAVLARVATLVDLALQRVELFERERASRTAAEAAGADLETLLYSVSHDLRSPLISVLGYLDVLRQEHGADLSGEGQHYLERISVNAVYMQALIADLLELSRIGRGDGPVEVLDLRAVAESVAESARLRHPDAQLVVGDGLPQVLTTDVRARQLLTNLVDNALGHGGRPDLRVSVTGRPAEDGGLLLQVADDGVGVPTEYRDRVLRVFERLDAPKSSPGTGMGLAICKKIVDSLGGTLSVGGPPPGAASGTTVSVLLPASGVVPSLPGPRRAPSHSIPQELV